MLNNYKNVALVLVILIIAFVVITYLKSLNVQEKLPEAEELTIPKKSCEETCKTDDCFYGCYFGLINIAVAEKNIDKCKEVEIDSIKQQCLDKVNLASGNCGKIKDQGLRDLC